MNNYGMNNGNGWYGGIPGMYGVNQGYNQVNVPKMQNTLSNDEIDELQKLVNPHQTIKPTPLEKLQSLCAHCYENGTSAIKFNEDGTGVCQRCGTHIDFNRTPSVEEVEALVAEVVNLEEIAKYASFSMNPKVKREYFGNTIPLLKKFGLIWKNSSDTIRNIVAPTPYTTTANPGSVLFGTMMGATPINNFGAGMGMPNMYTGAPGFNTGYNPMPNTQPAPNMGGYAPVQQPAPGTVPQSPFYQQPVQQPMQMQPYGGINPAFTGNYTAPSVDVYGNPVPQQMPVQQPAPQTNSTEVAPSPAGQGAETVKQTNV